ncbi:MAG: nitroreductase family deazaflavin-dependent oxidoreductase [Anaerolineales bacterium]|jgi:deazaflavin-dependent oxidoreductase (nitroreductase family)
MVIPPPSTGWLHTLLRKITASSLWIRLFPPNLHILIDRIAEGLSTGRTTLTGALGGVAVIKITAKGARTGKARSVSVVAIPQGEELILVASNFGRPHHPSWYYNLKASPQVAVTYGEQTRNYVAREVGGAEREACWSKAAQVYPGYRVYARTAAPRKIPIIVLAPSTFPVARSPAAVE